MIHSLSLFKDEIMIWERMMLGRAVISQIFQKSLRNTAIEKRNPGYIATEIHFDPFLLRMRLVFEYRIPMPLSVEEQRVGLRFMLMKGMYRYICL